eukprot:3275759-Rhodomonas_salina.2
MADWTPDKSREKIRILVLGDSGAATCFSGRSQEFTFSLSVRDLSGLFVRLSQLDSDNKGQRAAYEDTGAIRAVAVICFEELLLSWVLQVLGRPHFCISYATDRSSSDPVPL